MPNGDYGGYYTWPEMKDKIAAWRSAYPNLVHQTSLGRTLEGRDIPLLRLSDDAAVNENEPEVLLMAGIHPREQQPQVCLMRLIDELLDGYGRDARLTRIIKERQVWIIPVLNVDGKVFDMKNGNGTDKGADWRKNRRPNANGTVGVDLNRNFPVRWGGGRLFDPTWKATTENPAANIYEGSAPMSEPETRALTRFIEDRPRLRAFLDIHSPLRAIFFPPHLIAPEHERFTRLATRMQSLQKKPYPITKAAPNSEPAPGARGGNSGLTYHWSYYTRGVYSLNFEIGLPSRYPPVSEILAEYAANVREPLLYFLEASGDLEPVKGPGAAVGLSGRMSGALRPGATVTWTPEIEGPCDYAILISDSPEVVVPSEYRNVPLKTGFTLEVARNARPGARVPMTLYLWDRGRRVSVSSYLFIVEKTNKSNESASLQKRRSAAR